MAHELNTHQDLGKTPISEEQAKRIMELYQLKLSQAEESLTLADVAEALDVPVEEAAEFLRQASKETPESARPVRSNRQKGKGFRPDKVVICAAYIVGVLGAFLALWPSATGAAREVRNSVNTTQPRGPVSNAPKLWVPAIEQSLIQVPPGFSVSVGFGRSEKLYKSDWPIERNADRNVLRRSLERDLGYLVQDELHITSSVAAPTITRVPDGGSITVVVRTEAGEESFPVRISSSAFPLNPKNPATQKLMADIHDGLAENWNTLVPPK